LLLQGALIHCNVRIKDLSRFENVVTTALQRWTNDRAKVETRPVVAGERSYKKLFGDVIA